MKFGVNLRKQKTGAELSVQIQQICALLPVLYLFAGAGFPIVLTSRNAFAVLFDLGMSALPRLESLAISQLYRVLRSEVLVNFLLLGFALILGLAAGSLLRGSRRKARCVRWVLAGFIAADLLLRLLPLSFNQAFGLPCAVAGFLVQAACLVLTLLDLRADGRSEIAEKA